MHARRGLAALLFLVCAGFCVQVAVPPLAFAGDGYPGLKWEDSFRNVPLDGPPEPVDPQLCHDNGESGAFIAQSMVTEVRRERFSQSLENNTEAVARLTLVVSQKTTQRFGITANAELKIAYITGALGITYEYSKEMEQGAESQFEVPAHTTLRAYYGDIVNGYDMVLWEWFYGYLAPYGDEHCFISRTTARVESYVRTTFWT